MKTHWGVVNGWRDRQLPDGTVEWIAPDGQVYRTTPGSRLLFPELCVPTAPTTVNPADVPAAHTTGLTMPKRRTTRDDDRARRIEREREVKALLIAGEGGVAGEGETAGPDGAERPTDSVDPPF